MDPRMEDTALKLLANLPLSAVGNKSPKTLPCGAGDKGLALSGNVDEEQRLQGYLSRQKAALSAQRVVALKTLSRGDWEGGLGLVEVTSKKGAHWNTHGHTHRGGQLLLLPEEAVFLMECGSLEVSWNGVPFSLQQAYQVMLMGIPPQLYLVYSSLKRQGYIVYRVHQSTDSQVTEGAGRSEGERGGGGGGLTLTDTPVTTSSYCPLCTSVHHLASDPQLLEVHQPHSNFQKSKPGPPDHRVVVATPSDPFPPPPVIRYLNAIHPQAPLKYCIVDGSSISYYSIMAAAIPRIE